METAIIIFHIHKEHRTVDLEVPLDLTAKELAAGLNQADWLGVAILYHAAQRQQNVKRIRSKKRNDHKHGRVRRKREESYQISLPAAKAAADKERETAEERYGEQI